MEISMALGKGLNALIKEQNDNVTELAITEIEPNAQQPRKEFDKEKLGILADSIKQHGVIQPLVVMKKDNGYYEIIAGERRWRAARMAGLKTVPVVIRSYEQEKVLEVALVENLQREDLNPIDEARGYKELMDRFSQTQEQVSEKVGKSRSAVANMLRLLTLPDEVIKLLVSGELSAAHGRCVSSVEGKENQIELAQRIIKDKLSVREVENIVKEKKKPQKVKDPNIENAFSDAENILSQSLGTKVKISHKKNRGKIEINYYSSDELDRLLKILGG